MREGMSNQVTNYNLIKLINFRSKSSILVTLMIWIIVSDLLKMKFVGEGEWEENDQYKHLNWNDLMTINIIVHRIKFLKKREQWKPNLIAWEMNLQGGMTEKSHWHNIFFG